MNEILYEMALRYVYELNIAMPPQTFFHLILIRVSE